jgi:hypothetical protein
LLGLVSCLEKKELSLSIFQEYCGDQIMMNENKGYEEVYLFVAYKL